MDDFINKQIYSFKNKKYKLDNFKKYQYDQKIFFVEIKNQKLIYEKILVDSYHKKSKIIELLKGTLEKYNLKDTILLFNIENSYYYISDIPVFNFALPDNKQGLIFPTSDFIKFSLLELDYDEIKNDFLNYINTRNENNIYFKGFNTTEDSTNIRKKLSQESYPFNVILNKNQPEPLLKIKDSKYLLDIPTIKPWSIRFKFLALTNKVIFRISFYNSKYGERSYWKQYSDLFYNDEEDYIHLIYDLNYDKEIDNNIYLKIKNDILFHYNKIEKNKSLYDNYSNNIKSSSSKINNEITYKYIHEIINNYTENLIM
jgi:hypothetical protein